MRLKTVFIALAFSVVVFPLSTLGETADTGYYISPSKGADVYSSYKSSPKKIARLPYNTDVHVIEKKRGWWKIETITHEPAVSGWVFESVVLQRTAPKVKTRTARRESSSSSFLSSFSSLFRSSPQQQETAVLGVRGLEEEGASTEKASKEAKDAVKWMDTLAISHDDVAAFIREGNLKP